MWTSTLGSICFSTLQLVHDHSEQPSAMGLNLQGIHPHQVKVQPTWGGEVDEVDEVQMVDGDQWLLSDPANPQWHHAATNNVLPTGQQMHRVFHLTLALVCTFFACEPCKLHKSWPSWPRHVTNSSNVPGRNHLRNCSAKQFDPCYPPQEKALATFETKFVQQNLWARGQHPGNRRPLCTAARRRGFHPMQPAKCATCQPAFRFLTEKECNSQTFVKNTGLFQLAQNLSLVPFPTLAEKRR